MDFRFFKTPRETWDGMLADCRAAAKSIEMEQYILANDDVGRKFLEVFLEKLKTGVAVRLLLDRIGSRSVHDTLLMREIIAAGGQVRFYNPPDIQHLFRPVMWFPRNHTKTLLVDSQIAWIGGVCIDAAMADWSDIQVRFTGPLVAQIEERFSLERIGWRTRAKNFIHRKVISEGPFEYIVHRPHLGPNPIYRQLVRAVRSARESVDLVTPYFLPPYGLRRAMRMAARRGVKVRVMMSAATDAPIADCVSHSYFPFMYRHRIQIHLYQKTVLHAKYAIVDNNWATIGSSNLDYLSLKHNREANIIIRDAQTIGALRRRFDEDLQNCTQVARDYWHKLSLMHRIIGYLGRGMKKIL